MAAHPEQASPVQSPRKAPKALLRLARVPKVVLVLLFFIWVVLPLVPEETGFRFGVGFQIFFTASLLLSAIFFWFLGQERAPYPKSPLGVFASVAGVYLATVGLLVAFAVASPQFGLPRSEEEAGGQEAVKRGETLFFKAEVGCFLCHAIGGRGGTRGPDLTQVAARTGARVPGLSAERYLLEKVKTGATYQFNVPGYVPIMPVFSQSLSEEQLGDLVAYLLTLK